MYLPQQNSPVVRQFGPHQLPEAVRPAGLCGPGPNHDEFVCTCQGKKLYVRTRGPQYLDWGMYDCN